MLMLLEIGCMFPFTRVASVKSRPDRAEQLSVQVVIALMREEELPIEVQEASWRPLSPKAIAQLNNAVESPYSRYDGRKEKTVVGDNSVQKLCVYRLL